jgi:hypothetical protein
MRWPLLFLVLCACSGDAPLCDPPAHTVYGCDPVPAGSGGCVGGPVWSPVDGGSDAPRFQDDVGTTFPGQCHALIPDCSPYYKGSPRGFLCDHGVWSEGL